MEDLKIIVIGAGMGGMTSAIALKQAGYDAEAFEAVKEMRPVGAAISVWSNGVKCLNRLGLSHEIAALGGDLERMAYRDATSGEIMTDFSLQPLVDRVGQRPYPVARAELQTMLIDAFGRDRVRFGMRLVRLEDDGHRVTAHFEDGSQATGDLLVAADCVVYDYLINPAILAYAPPDAEKIYVGKHTGGFSWRQGDINRLLVDKARQFKMVIRLKGGDPFVFGRGGEEALALVEAGIEWEVVPGVSAGASVAAYAGIPITHRGLGSSVTFVTGHEDPNKTHSALNWERLANGADTLVVFMGVAKIGEIAERLIKHGRRADMPVAVIRWGTYQEQEIWVSDLANVAADIQHAKITSPALIVIGEVVRLRKQLQWFAAENPAVRNAA